MKAALAVALLVAVAVVIYKLVSGVDTDDEAERIARHDRREAARLERERNMPPPAAVVSFDAGLARPTCEATRDAIRDRFAQQLVLTDANVTCKGIIVRIVDGTLLERN